MKFGVFCPFHNPEGDYRRAIAAQADFVLHAEALGFDEAWVAEHHFNPNGVSSSILVLLGHLATLTTRIRIGSAAVLLSFRNPIQVAEDIATVDNISNGRLNFGVARGGSALLPNKHFAVSRAQARDVMLEGLQLVERLLYEDHVTFSGAHYRLDDVSLVPKPLQRPIPTFVATTNPDALAYAASRGYGTMAAPPYAIDRVAQIVADYRAAEPDADPGMTLSRFFYAASSRDEAMREAMPELEAFVTRKRAVTPPDNPVQPTELSLESILERSLIGSYDDIIEKLVRWRQRLPLRALLLRPMTRDRDRAKKTLDRFAIAIRPALPS